MIFTLTLCVNYLTYHIFPIITHFSVICYPHSLIFQLTYKFKSRHYKVSNLILKSMWPLSVCGSLAPLSSRGICAPLTATEGVAGYLVHCGSSLHLLPYLDLHRWAPGSSCESNSHLRCNWHHQVWRLFGGNKCARVVPEYGVRCVPRCVPDHRQTLAHNFHPADDKDKIYDLLHCSWIDGNLFDQHSVELWTFLVMLQFPAVICSIALISENMNLYR